jgi:predicted acetyltransferase
VVTICEEENIGSKKIIENNAGKFEDSCTNPFGKKILKYSFNLKKNS